MKMMSSKSVFRNFFSKEFGQKFLTIFNLPWWNKMWPLVSAEMYNTELSAAARAYVSQKYYVGLPAPGINQFTWVWHRSSINLFEPPVGLRAAAIIRCIWSQPQLRENKSRELVTHPRFFFAGINGTLTWFHRRHLRVGGGAWTTIIWHPILYMETPHPEGCWGKGRVTNKGCLKSSEALPLQLQFVAFS